MPDRFVSPSVSSSSFSKLCLRRRGTALGDLLPTIGIVILMLLVAGFDVASAAGRKGGKPSVFSLFNLKAKSKFWSEKVIRGDFDDLESSVLSDPGKMGAFNYTRAGNIANFLELSEVDSLYIPVPVNFVFIGFDGKGNHNFKLVPEELERWFTKIDHVFEHTRIPPIGEVLNPFYKISIDKAQHHHLPLVSHINYNFSVHAIQMGEKVTSIFEHAIKVFSRVDDISGARDNETLLWQVDIDMMDYLFSSLVDYLQLQDAYNIFILNPRHDAKKGKYGYRRGLSESEINLLRTDRTLQAKVLQPDTKVEGLFEFDRNKIRKPLYKTHPMSTFAWTEAEEIDTSEWSRMCLDALSKVENVLQWKDHSEITYTKVSQILHGKIDHMRLLFEKGLKSGDVAGLHSECLTDTWIGRDRWACIDLSAGPFSWGPAVGGEGVRTELSLPSVGKTIGAVAEITEEEAEDRLQDTIRERFSVFGDDHQAIDILLAEIDIYELFAFKHCKGRKVKLALCEELDERMRDLKNELQAYDGEEHDDSHKKKAVDALKRMENWNLFSDAYEDFHNYTVARDSFLAHLGATLWGSMRHVIAPSFADGAYHYYETISFQLFFITQEKVRNVKQLPVNLKALEEGLSSLLVSPSQKVMFSPQLLMLSEDPALTMAFSVARRAAAVPMLLVNGTYRSTIRSYLDSSVLQHQLQTLSGHAFLKGRHSNSRTTLEVPIFWFIHSDSLFVDKYYQTKALSDMIIVVQSDSSSWESHLQCNGQSILWDLRIPIKAAVSAAAEHLAGLLPLHLIYNQAHETAIEDWIWSVGCSPLSVTSHGWQISHFQTDSLARSYIFTSLEESIQIVNEAIHLLLMERTTEQGFKVFKSQERVLVEKYNSIVSSWRRISTSLGDLHYSDAVRFLSMLDEATKGFKDSVNSTIALLHPIHCTQERKIDVEVDMTTIPAFLVVGAILWFVLRPRRPKAKIN